MLILIFSFFILILILFLPLTIDLEYIRKKGDDSFNLNIYVFFRFLNLNIRIPYIQSKFFGFFLNIFAEIDSFFINIIPWREKLEFEEELSWKNIHLEKLKKLIKLLTNRDLIRIIISGLNIKCLKFYWNTEYGWGNPAFTGISYGIIWTIKGTILSFLSNKVCIIPNPYIELKADFDNKKFITHFKGIFSVHLGNIILTTLRILFYNLKGGLVKWENIQLKN
jgi:hypothetical protein